MRYLYLIVLMFLLVGCTKPDPWSAAIAQERSVIAHNAQANTAAQIEHGQSADADRRNVQARLEALQSQQAIVQGQAVIAHAGSQTAIVASYNEALVLVANRIIEATRPDYTPLYSAMAGLVVVAVVWIVVNVRRPLQPVVVAQSMPQAPKSTQTPVQAPQSATQPASKPVVVYMTEHVFAYRLPDETIILHRYRDGKERVYLPTDPFYQRLLTGGK